MPEQSSLRRDQPLGVIGVRLPRGIVIVCLIAPRRPASSRTTRKHFKIWTRRTALYQIVKLIWFPRVLALHCPENVYLPPSWGKCASVLASSSEEHELCRIPEIETHSTSVRTAVFANLVPDDVGLVLEAPRFHDAKPLGKKRIGNPQVEMRSRKDQICNW